MLGQFCFPNLQSLNLRLKALLRHTNRAEGVLSEDAGRPPIRVDLRIFEDGELKYINPNYGEIPCNGILEISEDTCPMIIGEKADRVIVARCSMAPENNQFLAQAHQLIYENKPSGHFTSLLYDQMPVQPSTRTPAPIITLAPKMWVSRKMNSFIVFINSWDTTEVREQPEPIRLSILTSEGSLLKSIAHRGHLNSVWTLDVRAVILDRVKLSDEPQFLNIVARGGASTYAVMTFLKSDETGNLALEHTLAPPYYSAGRMDRIRTEALRAFE